MAIVSPSEDSAQPRSLSKLTSLTRCAYQTSGPCADPEGGKGVRTPPLKNYKNIGFPSNIGPDPLKNHKATKPIFNVRPSSARKRNAIVSGIWIIFPSIKTKLKAEPPLAKFSGSAHVPGTSNYKHIFQSKSRLP